jgi:pyruvate formate lyase activating enzyme
MSVPAVMEAVRADMPFYEESGGGVTFTGGEPLAQPEFILGLLEACRAEGIRSALDTSGFADRELVVRAGTLADIVLFDLKLLDDGRHRAATGVSNVPILENLAALYEEGARVLLRLPLIPGINDAPKDLEQMAHHIASLATWAGPQKAHILPYHSAAKGKYSLRGETYAMGDTPEPSAEDLRKAAAVFEAAGISVTIGG